MAWAFLNAAGRQIKRAGGNVNDVFNANSASDIRKREARGEASRYQQQQADKGNPHPESQNNVVQRGFSFLGNTAKTAAEPAIFFAKTDIINPAKEVAGAVTGNKKASQNAIKSQFGGTDSPTAALRQIAGQGVGLGLTFLAPGTSKLVEAGVAKTGATGAVKKIATGAGTGAAVGAPFNVASTVASGEPLTPESVLKSAAIGAVGGAVLGGAGTAAGVALQHAHPLVPNESGSISAGHNPETLSKLAKATTPEQVKTILGNTVSPQVKETVASAIAHTKDPNIVKNILDKNTPPSPINDLSNSAINSIENTGQTKPGGVKRAGGFVENGTAPPIRVRTLEDGTKSIEDGAHRLEYARKNNIQDFPIEDVTHLYDPAKTPPVPKAQDIISATVPPANNPFNEITGAITGQPAVKGQASSKGLAMARREQNELLSQERGQRFRQVNKLGESEFGDAGFYKRKGALKGEYTKVENPYKDKFTPEQSQELFVGAQKKIYSTPDSVYEKDWKQNGLKGPLHAAGAKFSTEVAVRKVLGLEPGIPTDSELRLLRIHSPKLAEEIKASIPKDRKLFDLAADIAGSSRALKSGADLSMGGRQGLFVAVRHPIQWAKANRESVKFAKDEEHYVNRMKQIGDDPWVKAGDSHDIGLQGVKGLQEEAYNNADLAGKVPLIRRAERAYTGGLSELRASLWKNALQRYGKTPEAAVANLGEKGLEGLAETVRTLTGRGGKKGGFIDKRAKTLGEALFSPRLWASRLEPFNPAFWKRIGPAGRKEAFESLASFATVAALVLEAAHAAGAEVETDARSSDFLKIKVGDTRYDVLGGFQQNLVFGWRQLTGERKSSQNGKVTTFATDIGDKIAGRKKEDVVGGGPYTGNRLTAAADLVSNKAAPIPASALKLLKGEDRSGNPVNPFTEIGQLFVPIGLQSAWKNAQGDESNTDKIKNVAKGLPEFVGLGSQTYGKKDISLSKNQKAYVQQLKDGGASPEKIKANTDFFQTLKTGPDRAGASAKVKEALTNGDIEKAKQIAVDYNKAYAATFKDWAGKYGKYGDKTLTKEYNKNKITEDSLRSILDNINKDKKGGL